MPFNTESNIRGSSFVLTQVATANKEKEWTPVSDPYGSSLSAPLLIRITDASAIGL